MRNEVILTDVPATELADRYWQYREQYDVNSSKEDAFMYIRGRVTTYAEELNLTDDLYRVGMLRHHDNCFHVEIHPGRYRATGGKIVTLKPAITADVQADIVDEVVIRTFAR